MAGRSLIVAGCGRIACSAALLPRGWVGENRSAPGMQQCLGAPRRAGAPRLRYIFPAAAPSESIHALGSCHLRPLRIMDAYGVDRDAPRLFPAKVIAALGAPP